MKSVRNKEADFCIASLTITRARYTQIDFSIPFMETGIGIIVARGEGVLSPAAIFSIYLILFSSSNIFFLKYCYNASSGGTYVRLSPKFDGQESVTVIQNDRFRG